MSKVFISDKRHKFYINTVILFSFIILSILSGIFMYHSHFAVMESDLEFHWQRIFEIRSSLIEGHFFSPIALDYFHQSGSAVMTMYPKINILPIVFLSFIVKSQVLLFNIAFIFRNFFALLISYMCSYFFNKNKKVSYLFSISYVLSGMGLYYYAGVSALGTLSVITYLPLVLFGFLSLLEKNKWIELSLGVSAIIFSHTLSFGIILFFLLIMFLINIEKFKSISKIYSLFKAVFMTIMITSIYWIPFIWISSHNELSIPTSDNLVGHDFNALLSAPLDNMVSDGIGFFSFIGLILGFVFYKKISAYIKQLLWVSLLFLVFSSDLFPWSIASHTFIRHLQFPSRLYVIPQLLLCYIFAELLIGYLKNNSRENLLIILLSFFVIILQMGAQESIVNQGHLRPELTTPYNNNTNYILKNNKDFNNILKSESNNTDYYPVKLTSPMNNISSGSILINDHINNPVYKMGNGTFSFSLKKTATSISLPFIYYNGISYSVKVDGEKVNAHSSQNDLIVINNVNKGKHTVQVIVHRSWYDYLSYVLSSLGIVILLYSLIKEYWLKRKNE